MRLFPRLLEILLPRGGYTVASIEAYFDESGTHDGSFVLCFAGFIIREDQARIMDAEWKEMLEESALPYFHMVDCANGTGVFKSLSTDSRIAAEKKAIAVMRSRIAQCFVVSVDPVVFEREMPSHSQIGTAYSLLAHSCLTNVSVWADKHGFNGDVAYFFESGHKSQAEANGIMNMIFSQDHLRTRHRYASHTFADKKKVPLLQAADIIAWLWNNECKRNLMNRTNLLNCRQRRRRADLSELVRPIIGTEIFCVGLHLDSKMLRMIAMPVMHNEYPLTYPWRK